MDIQNNEHQEIRKKIGETRKVVDWRVVFAPTYMYIAYHCSCRYSKYATYIIYKHCVLSLEMYIMLWAHFCVMWHHLSMYICHCLFFVIWLRNIEWQHNFNGSRQHHKKIIPAVLLYNICMQSQIISMKHLLRYLQLGLIHTIIT